MWHPSKAQWRIIWTLAAAFTVLALLLAVKGDDNVWPLVLGIAFDSGLVVWRLQRPPQSR